MTDADRHRRRRRPYQPPKVVEHAEFETLALACGKTPGSPSCNPNYGGTGYTNS